MQEQSGGASSSNESPATSNQVGQVQTPHYHHHHLFSPQSQPNVMAPGPSTQQYQHQHQYSPQSQYQVLTMAPGPSTQQYQHQYSPQSQSQPNTMAPGPSAQQAPQQQLTQVQAIMKVIRERCNLTDEQANGVQDTIIQMDMKGIDQRQAQFILPSIRSKYNLKSVPEILEELLQKKDKKSMEEMAYIMGIYHVAKFGFGAYN